eukprot:scaffold115393_cov63-Phaeocystis_antarctica.AAC.4
MAGLVSVAASMLGTAPPRSTDAAARLEEVAVRTQEREASRAGCSTRSCSMVSCSVHGASGGDVGERELLLVLYTGNYFCTSLSSEHVSCVCRQRSSKQLPFVKN